MDSKKLAKMAIDAHFPKAKKTKTIRLIKDMIGTEPVKVDQRTRNADGSLKHPEQQKEKRITTLRRVWLKRENNQTWLMWEWDMIPQTPFCNWSGIVLNDKLTNDYALEIIGESEIA